jgi:hypothetical protein
MTNRVLLKNCGYLPVRRSRRTPSKGLFLLAHLQFGLAFGLQLACKLAYKLGSDCFFDRRTDDVIGQCKNRKEFCRCKKAQTQ